MSGTGFAGDALERAPLAMRLTTYVDRLNEGAVIGLSGEWGSGKTWFGLRWRDLLSTDHKTIFIDAFENDYSDDAFVVIAAHILRALSDNQEVSAELLEASKKIGVALLPVTAKVGMAAAIRFITGLSASDLIDVVAEQIEEGGGKSAEKFVEERLRHHEDAQKGVEHFKKELEKLCVAQQKPVVFFIDELDRCRPHFAVQIIERIKHFFDIPNLVFVLLLNRRQLERAIEGIYGPIDASSYLHKFVHFFLTLPSPAESGDERFGREFCEEVARRNGLTQTEASINFVQAVMRLVPRLKMTLRDIERAFIVFALSSSTIKQGTAAAADLPGFFGPIVT